MTRKIRFTVQKYYFFCIYQNFFVPLRKIMTKRTVYHIVEWTIALIGCAFLVYKLVTYDDYASLGESLRAMGVKQWSALVLCLLLMPVNMGLEAWKWRTLIPMSWRDAHYQVYYSKLAGLITPWRLGEYPARGLLMEKSEWGKVLSMGAVGSATMTAAIILAGLGSLGILGLLGKLGNIVDVGYYLFVGALLLLLLLALIFAPRLLRRWATISHRLILISTAQSFVRLACWCVQLYLVLFALDAIYHLPFTIYHLPIYYLLVTVTPNVPIAEAGVRGAWAIVLFGSVNAALAGVLLWAINTLIPCLVWPFLRKNAK